MANVLIETWPRAAIERAAAGQAAAGGSSQADGSGSCMCCTTEDIDAGLAVLLDVIFYAFNLPTSGHECGQLIPIDEAIFHHGMAAATFSILHNPFSRELVSCNIFLDDNRP